MFSLSGCMLDAVLSLEMRRESNEMKKEKKKREEKKK
jgi:hypothetical protein